MKKTNSKKIEQLVTPIKSGGDENISLEQIESLCGSFTRRPRGCNSFSSIEDEDDLLF